MSLFGRKEKKQLEEERRSFDEEIRAITAIEGYWPDAGLGTRGQVAATASRALSLVPVFGAARLLADTLASLPLCLYSRNSQGIPVRQPTPSLFAQPSIHGTVYDWIFRAVVSMALQGDAIGLITAQDFYGFPTMVEWLNPEQVATQDGKLYGPGSYIDPQWWWWGRPVNPRKLIHIPWFTLPYRVRGLSPIGAYQLTTNIGIGAKEYAANWFGQGGVPPGTFKNAERVIDKKDADNLTARLTARLQARQPLVFGRDWEYTPIAIKPHEAQFVETCQLTATDIAVIYGLPPEKIGGTTGKTLTYSTTELNSIDYLTFSARPWMVRFEYALTRCFPRGLFVKFDPHEMLRVDAKTLAQINSTALGFQNGGWMIQDEVRAGYDKQPLPKALQPLTPAEKLKAMKPVAPQQNQNGNDNQQNGNQQNGNGAAPQQNNGKPRPGGSNANESLAKTRSGRQAYLEVMALEPEYMRSRVTAR
jgi:HK97 family phage portal protein